MSREVDVGTLVNVGYTKMCRCRRWKIRRLVLDLLNLKCRVSYQV